MDIPRHRPPTRRKIEHKNADYRNRERKSEQHNQDVKNDSFIEIPTRFTSETQRSSPSLLHLIIENEIQLMAHFNLRNANENRISGYEPQPPWVLFISLTKRLKCHRA
jgi:hypothetical protein